MDNIIKKRLAFWGVILLAIMNLFSLVTVWYLHFHRPDVSNLEMPPPNRVTDFLKNELGLSETQTHRADSIIEDHFKKVGIILYSMRDIRKELLKEVSVGTPDFAKIEKLADEIGNKHSELEKLKFYHFFELKKTCTPDQQKKLDKIFRDILPEIGPPGMPPGQTPQGFPNENFPQRPNIR